MLFTTTNARRLTCALLMALIVAAPTTAQADHHVHSCVTTKLVTVTEFVRRPVHVTVIRYDHCGRPQKVTVTEFRTVEITVTKRIPVRY
jgi:hypothetical protein